LDGVVVRHSYATAALAAGVPAKVVSERLGHANIAITMDTYSHVLPGMDEIAAATVARLILDDQAADEDAVDKALTTRPRAPEARKEGSAIPLLGRGTEWGDRRDSNPRPSGPQPMFRVRPSRKGLAR
jgi:Phage integrase family